jgi:ribosomal protein S30
MNRKTVPIPLKNEYINISINKTSFGLKKHKVAMDSWKSKAKTKKKFFPGKSGVKIYKSRVKTRCVSNQRCTPKQTFKFFNIPDEIVNVDKI